MTMSTTAPTQPPILSTPETHIFEDPTPPPSVKHIKRTKAELWSVYEIEKTARSIWEGGYERVALQFPDWMLGDGVGVFEGLEERLSALAAEDGPRRVEDERSEEQEHWEKDFTSLQVGEANGTGMDTKLGIKEREDSKRRRMKLYILADTSYGSCCVDEIAASHVDADVVVHFGRACLSPTARLPVIYVYTTQPLNRDAVVLAFERTFPEKQEKVVLMAGLEMHSHTPSILEALKGRGYSNLYAPEVMRDPGGIIPNRKVDEAIASKLQEWSLFHTGEPMKALLLTLSSRLKDLYIFPTPSDTATTTSTTPSSLKQHTTISLRRRYALLSTLRTTPIIGILINTLSVSDTLPALTSLQKLISSAGKKYYTFVVGKVNAAKMANFSEVGAWVVVGCWESSLLENEGGEGWWKPVVTPWECGVALSGGGKEGWEWDGRWRGDFGGLEELELKHEANGDDAGDNQELDDEEEEEESEPPEFDLRTGRYVQHSRPMRIPKTSSNPQSSSSSSEPTAASNVLTRRAKGELATVNGAVSPGAEYLKNQRTWTGLGSDFDKDAEEGDVRINGASIEEGRNGVARGYRVGESGEKT